MSSTSTPDSERGEFEFRRLLDTLPAAAYLCDARGLITYYNQEALRVWGRAPALCDPADRYCGSFKLFARDGTPLRHDQCWMAMALAEDRGFNGEEIVVERPNGERVTALAHANPLHDEHGRVIGAVNVLVDITERQRAESVLRDADRARNQFLATLAHELRNPLAPIRNAAKILDLLGAPTNEGQWALEVIDRQLHHMSRLIDDLVDVARITSNRLELKRRPMSLAEAIQTAIETSAPELEAAGLQLEIQLPPEPLRMDGDHTRLAQVVAILLDNAARYTERGGKVWLEAERRGHHAVIHVRDTGIGIAADRIASIFEIFAKGDPSSDRVSRGLGVGLTLARRLVELHGGSIDARSEGPGFGSEFTVVLQLEGGEAVAADPEGGQAGNVVHPGHRVLVVDDNLDAATSLALLLRTLHHFVRTAHDGPEALIAAEEFRPEVVLLDIGMPGMNGYEVARSLRERDSGRGALIIAVTGWGQESDRLRSHDAGFDHHVVKPMALPLLSRLLEAAPTIPVGARPTTA